MTQHTKPETPPPAEESSGVAGDSPKQGTVAPLDPLAGLVRGRIVLYHPRPYEARHCDPGPWPAMVTNVGDGGECTLNVNMPVPAPVGTDPVARMVGVKFTAQQEPGCWSWMFDGQGTSRGPVKR